MFAQKSASSYCGASEGRHVLKDLRLRAPLYFALLAAMAVIACFSLIPGGTNPRYVDYGTFRQTLMSAVLLATLYLFSGEWQLDVDAGTKDLSLKRTLGVVAAAAAVIGFAAVYVQGSVISPPRHAIIMFVVLMFGTAVFEEILFRGFFLEGFAKTLRDRGSKNALLYAALASSLLFGVLHVTSDLGSLFRVEAYIQAVVKVLEGTLFGMAMCALSVKTKSIWPAVAAHFAFNLLSEGPVFLATGALKFTYITGSPADITVLLVGCAVLLPAAKWAWDYLAH